MVSVAGIRTRNELRYYEPVGAIIVDFRITDTLQTGAVGNRTYRTGESVYL